MTSEDTDSLHGLRGVFHSLSAQLARIALAAAVAILSLVAAGRADAGETGSGWLDEQRWPLTDRGDAVESDTVEIYVSSDSGDVAVRGSGGSGGTCSSAWQTLSGPTNSVTNLPNFTSLSSCPSTVAAFSMDRAAQLQLSNWKPESGDVAYVNLSAPRRAIPMRVWIAPTDLDLVGRASEDDEQMVAETYQLHVGTWLEAAESTLKTSMTGLRLHPTSIEVVDGRSLAVIADATYTTREKEDCTPFKAVCGLENAYDPGAINVYVVTDLNGWNGMTCNDGRLIAVEGTALSATLAHELGHALGLSHVETWTEKEATAVPKNLMCVSSPACATPGARDTFTLGQAFRMHASSSSVASQLYPDETIKLDCSDPGAHCPRPLEP